MKATDSERKVYVVCPWCDLRFKSIVLAGKRGDKLLPVDAEAMKKHLISMHGREFSREDVLAECTESIEEKQMEVAHA